KIFKLIKNAIIKLENRNTTLADCYFALIGLGNSIHKISKEIHKQFYQYAIKIFNSRYKEYKFDEYLLAYFLHPDYKGASIQKNQFLKIATSASNIWQQIVKIPKIATQLKNYKHSKQKSEDILITQFREFYLNQNPFNVSFLSNIDSAL
ncbi:10280_t:CDS:2, partial [Cetraspora pellucida]